MRGLSRHAVTALAALSFSLLTVVGARAATLGQCFDPNQIGVATQARQDGRFQLERNALAVWLRAPGRGAVVEALAARGFELDLDALVAVHVGRERAVLVPLRGVTAETVLFPSTVAFPGRAEGHSFLMVPFAPGRAPLFLELGVALEPGRVERISLGGFDGRVKTLVPRAGKVVEAKGAALLAEDPPWASPGCTWCVVNECLLGNEWCSWAMTLVVNCWDCWSELAPCGDCYVGIAQAVACRLIDCASCDEPCADILPPPVVPELVLIPAGNFVMGSPSEELGRRSDETLHEVTLTSDFYIGNSEVTQAQWVAVMGANPSYYTGCDQCPVESVSWLDAVNYCNALSLQEGRVPAYVVDGNNVTWLAGGDGYRLPTEAEWEYACRAGSATAFYNGEITERYCERDPNLEQIGWYCWNNDPAGTKEIGEKVPNGWGLFDSSGNVQEWCWDWYGDYPTEPVSDPTGPAEGTDRVRRGGHFNYSARYCRSASRTHLAPDLSSPNVGFRIAASVVE